MMGHRQKLKGGEEYDAIHARHHYKYIWHHSHNVKKALARRERRAARNNLKIEGDINKRSLYEHSPLD